MDDPTKTVSVGIERKELMDWFGVCGRGRNRFMREMDLLAHYGLKAVIIEAEMQNILHPELTKRSRLNKAQVLGTIAVLLADYGIPVIAAGNRRSAEEITYRMISRYFEKRKVL